MWFELPTKEHVEDPPAAEKAVEVREHHEGQGDQEGYRHVGDRQLHAVRVPARREQTAEVTPQPDAREGDRQIDGDAPIVPTVA